MIRDILVYLFFIGFSAVTCVVVPFNDADNAERKYLNERIDSFKLELKGETLDLNDPAYQQILRSGGPEFLRAFNSSAIWGICATSIMFFLYCLLSREKNFLLGMLASVALCLTYLFLKVEVLLVPLVFWVVAVYINRVRFKHAT